MEEDLTKIHTKVLLKMLAKLRIAYCTSGWEEDFDFEARNKRIQEVKAELAKRPHVPNKKEAKKLRQEAAKRRR